MSIRGISSSGETETPETIVLNIGGVQRVYSSIDSGISFSSVQNTIYKELAVPSRTHQRARHQPVLEEIELQSYPRQYGFQSVSRTGFPGTSLVRPSAVALPPSRIETMPFTVAPNSATASTSRESAGETTPSYTCPFATWSAVRDPVALMGPTQYTGLVGVKTNGKIVGLPPKVLHATFNVLDPCTATCK
jgi:hypothetical protein